jgi:flagellar hook-length control protein FliK
MSLPRVTDRTPSRLIPTPQPVASSPDASTAQAGDATSSTEPTPFDATLAAAQQSRADNALTPNTPAAKTAKVRTKSSAEHPATQPQAPLPQDQSPPADPTLLVPEIAVIAETPAATDCAAMTTADTPAPAASSDAATVAPDRTIAVASALVLPAAPHPSPTEPLQTSTEPRAQPPVAQDPENPLQRPRPAHVQTRAADAAPPLPPQDDTAHTTPEAPPPLPDLPTLPPPTAAHEKHTRAALNAGTPATPASPQQGADIPAAVASASAPMSVTALQTSPDAIMPPTPGLPTASDEQPSPRLVSFNHVTATATGHAHPNIQAEAAPPAQETPRTDTPDPLEQVVLGLKGKFDARSGKAQITLDPPNLGTVKVALSLDHGALTAEFQSDSGMVRDLLKGNLEKLKSVLEGQGVAVDRLAVATPPAADTGAAPRQGQQNAFGSPAHDGRSSGHYQQDSQPGRQHQDPNAFARHFRQAQDAPLDLVA